MPSIKLTYHPEEAKLIFKKYTIFEQKNAFEKIPLKFLFGILIILIAFGFLVGKHFLIYLGIISMAFLLFYLLFYVIKFKRFYDLICKEIDRNNEIHNQEYVFSFDEKGISKKFKDFSNKYTWNLIQKYVENDGDLYLYSSDRRLYDIISKQLIGEENYLLFLDILEKEFTLN